MLETVAEHHQEETLEGTAKEHREGILDVDQEVLEAMLIQEAGLATEEEYPTGTVDSRVEMGLVLGSSQTHLHSNSSKPTWLY